MRFFLNDIDWSKNIIFFIVYILVVLLCVVFYFIPIMQNHKAQTLDYKRIQSLDNAIAQNESTLQQSMDSIENANQNIKNKLNMDTLGQYVKRYIDDATIIDEGISDSTNDIKIQHISIKGSVQHTRAIIDFIDNLNSLNNSIRVGFPINITKQENELQVSLAIDVYYSNYRL